MSKSPGPWLLFDRNFYFEARQLINEPLADGAVVVGEAQPDAGAAIGEDDLEAIASAGIGNDVVDFTQAKFVSLQVAGALKGDLQRAGVDGFAPLAAAAVVGTLIAIHTVLAIATMPIATMPIATVSITTVSITFVAVRLITMAILSHAILAIGGVHFGMLTAVA